MALEDDKINATDDPKLAEKNGLTHWDEARGQWVAPPAQTEANADADAEADVVPEPGPEVQNPQGLFVSPEEPE